MQRLCSAGRIKGCVTKRPSNYFRVYPYHFHPSYPDYEHLELGQKGYADAQKHLWLTHIDLFDDSADFGGGTGGQGYVHIRVQQRNARKTLTTIQGLPDELDLKRILKAFKMVGITHYWLEWS